MLQPQTYTNHARVAPLFDFFVLPVLTVNAINAVRHVWYRAMRDTVWEVVVAWALVALALAARTMAISVVM